MRWIDQHRKLSAVIGVLAALMLIGAVSNGSTNQPATPTRHVDRAAPKVTPPPEPTKPPVREKAVPHTTRSQLRAIVLDELGDDGPDDRPRIVSIDHDSDGWIITYNSSRASDTTMLDEQRMIFARAFGDIGVKALTLLPRQSTVTQGGVEGWDEYFSITCTGRDNREIDWDNILPDGMKTVCDYIQLIRK